MVKITTQIQMRRLIELMEENEHLAKNFKRGYEKNFGWEDVAKCLNSFGPPMRNGKEWQKVWFDAKFKVKQKLLFNKKEDEATGGGPFKKKFLNDLEEAIVRLLSLDQVINPTGYAAGGSFHFASRKPTAIASSTPLKSGDLPSCKTTPNTNESSCPVSAVINYNEIQEVDYNLTQSSSDLAEPVMPARENLEDFLPEDVRPKIKRKQKENVFQKMLQKQTEVQEKLFSSINESLKEINTNLQKNVTSTTAIERHLSECARYQRKNFYIQEEQLKMLKLKMKREDQQNFKSNDLKLTDLEIRKRQIDIEERKLELLDEHNK